MDLTLVEVARALSNSAILEGKKVHTIMTSVVLMSTKVYKCNAMLPLCGYAHLAEPGC